MGVNILDFFNNSLLFIIILFYLFPSECACAYARLCVCNDGLVNKFDV